MTKLVFLGCDQDAYCASVARHIQSFEESTGHEVRVRILGNDEYFTNRLGSYLEGENAADVYMSGPVLVWQHYGAGYVEPLDPFLARASSGYDPDDFFPSLLRSNKWSGRFGDPLGVGPLLEIPVNCESYNLAYVPEILDRAGLSVPNTWSEYFAVSRTITERARPCRGFAQRGTDAWHTIYTGFASQFWTFGGVDFDGARICAIAEPHALRATAEFLGALASAGPTNWTNQRWYELALDFAAGRYGLIVDSDHYVAYFEDATKSKMKGKIAYRLPPAGEDGVIRSNLWSWSVVMNSRSRNKDAAWEFMEWATGRDFLLRSTYEGNMNPTRRSTWDSSRFLEAAAAWGDFAVVARKLVEEIAEVQVTPCVNYIEVARRWTRALLDAYQDPASVETHLRAAAAEIDVLVDRYR
ncbi:MAG: extracellular solute-binding protein [Steroidobacteraceae bacterium]